MEALGVWATSVSSPSATTVRGTAEQAGARAGGTGEEPSAAPAYGDPPPGARDDSPPGARDDAPGGARGGAGRCEHCGGVTGVGRAASCQVCPVCQGIALLRTVRPETVDRLADLAGAVAATLRDVAAHVRTGSHGTGWNGSGTHAPGPGASGGGPGGRATVQDIPVDDGDTTDEGDDL
jgi:hypothetical protein